MAVRSRVGAGRRDRGRMRGYPDQRHLDRPGGAVGRPRVLVGAGLDPRRGARPVRVVSHGHSNPRRSPHPRRTRTPPGAGPVAPAGHALACAPHRRDQVHARTVGQVDVAGGGEQHEVRRPTDDDPAGTVSTQGASTSAGRGPQGLGDGHVHLTHGHGDAPRHRGGERGAGVAVGGQGDRDARVQEPTRIGIGRAGAELGSGQQRGDGAGAGERVDVSVGQVRAVVR